MCKGFRLASIARRLEQSVHGHPIVAGMVSRLSDDHWKEITKAPLIGALLRTDPTPSALTPARVTEYFRRWNIRAIVVHPSAGDNERAAIAHFLPIVSHEHFGDGTELWWVQ